MAKADFLFTNTLKVVCLIFFLEGLGAFLGPSCWLWIRSRLDLDNEQLHQYHQSIDRYLHFNHHLLLTQQIDFLSQEHGELLPVVLFTNSNPSLTYWAWPYRGKLSEHDIVLGEKGVLGRVGKAKGQVFNILPVNQSSLQIAVSSLVGGAPLVLTGDGEKFSSIDKGQSYTVGTTLYTLIGDLNYPSQYPVAQITQVQEGANGNHIIATPLDSLVNYHYVRVYHKDKALPVS